MLFPIMTGLPVEPPELCVTLIDVFAIPVPPVSFIVRFEIMVLLPDNTGDPLIVGLAAVADVASAGLM